MTGTDASLPRKDTGVRSDPMGGQSVGSGASSSFAQVRASPPPARERTRILDSKEMAEDYAKDMFAQFTPDQLGQAIRLMTRDTVNLQDVNQHLGVRFGDARCVNRFKHSCNDELP